MAAWINAVAVATAVVATSLVMRRLVRDARQSPAPAADGSVTLRYGPIVGGTGIAAIVLSLAFLAIGLLAPPRPDQRAPWLGLVVAFGVSGLGLLLAAMRYRLAVGPTGMVQRSLFSRERALSWHDVRGVRFSPTSGYVTLEGDATRVRASAMLRGIDRLWDSIEANVPRAAWQDARTRFDTYVQGLTGAAR